MDKHNYWEWEGRVYWVFLTAVLKAVRVPAEDASGGILFHSWMAEGKKEWMWVLVLDWGRRSLLDWPGSAVVHLQCALGWSEVHKATHYFTHKGGLAGDLSFLEGSGGSACWRVLWRLVVCLKSWTVVLAERLRTVSIDFMRCWWGSHMTEVYSSAGRTSPL